MRTAPVLPGPSLYTVSASAHAVPVYPCGLAPAEGVPEDVAAHCLRSASVPLRVVRLALDIEIEGSVEDVDDGYDKVYFEAHSNNFYFSSHDGIPDGVKEECVMIDEYAAKNNLILANSTVKLRYNTVGYRWHSGAYAEIMYATNTGPYKVVVSGADVICVGETAQMEASGAAGAPYIWSGNGDISVSTNGQVTGLEPGIATVIATDAGGCSGEKEIVVLNLELDIRETAQPQNRVGRDDPRVLARVRNRILVWANTGANTITFDLIKPPDITSPVWIQIEDQTGLNAGMPHFEQLNAASKTFTYTVVDDNDGADFHVRYGADLNSDGTLSGIAEIKGTYEVYGVTAEDHAESRHNYNWFYLPGALYRLADQLHRRFANGAFDSGEYQPTITSGRATLGATRLTHDFGANFTDAGFVTLEGRQYYAATVTFPIYHYAANSDASELIRESSELKDGLDAFVKSLSHTTVAAAYAAAPGGTTRSVTFSLDGGIFQFGATGSIGLGGVGVNSAEPYSSAGIVMLQITRNGSSYDIGTDATIDLTLHDIFDFDYFTTGWLAGFSDSSRSAAMIQNGFGKAGSVANVGQVGLVEIEVDGSVSITERIVTP